MLKDIQDAKEYGFRDQITRSGLSIPSNIAEGYERGTDKDRAKFLSYAKGSCAELRTQLYIGMEADFIDKKQGAHWVHETHELSKMLYSLAKYIQQKL